MHLGIALRTILCLLFAASLFPNCAAADDGFLVDGQDAFTNACPKAAAGFSTLAAAIPVTLKGMEPQSRQVTIGFTGRNGSMTMPPFDSAEHFRAVLSALTGSGAFLVALPLSDKERIDWARNQPPVAAKWALFGVDRTDSASQCSALSVFSPFLRPWTSGFPSAFEAAFADATNQTVNYRLSRLTGDASTPEPTPPPADPADDEADSDGAAPAPTSENPTFNLTVCNRSRHDAGLALYRPYAPGDANYVVTGWIKVRHGQCQDVDAIPRGDFSYYAASDGETGYEWTGKGRRLCVEASAFSRIYMASYHCARQFVKQFTDLDITTDRYTLTLR